MSGSCRTVCRVIFCLITITLMLSGLLVMAQPQPIGHLIPIGGGYSDTYAGFAQAAVANARNNLVNILVLPLAYSSNPEVITDSERAANLRDAGERRFQIEEACKRRAAECDLPGHTCPHHHRGCLAAVRHRVNGRPLPKIRRLSFDRGTSFGYTNKRCTAAHS